MTVLFLFLFLLISLRSCYVYLCIYRNRKVILIILNTKAYSECPLSLCVVYEHTTYLNPFVSADSVTLSVQ